MSGIDYHALETNLQSILAATTGLTPSDGVKIHVEEDFHQIVGLMDNGKSVIIYLDDRVPTAGQPLAANTKTRYHIGLSIWCLAVAVDSFSAAAALRDGVVDKVERALMANDKINNLVAGSWLHGGEFLSARKKGGMAATFMAAAEIKLVAEATSSTT